MKQLNLAYPERSEITYKTSKFPDGQRLITITPFEMDGVVIKSRMSWDDIQLVVCAVKALRGLGVKHIELYVPYFLGARSDRKFEEGSINYIKDIIAPIINALKFDKVTVLDPHSFVLEGCLDNINPLDNADLVVWAADQITPNWRKDMVIITPDDGASKKVFALSKKIGFESEIVVCSKHRNAQTGEIESVDIGNVVDFKKRDIVLIDDICDGGWTFTSLATKIKLLNVGKMRLIITHGIFSKGFTELLKYFDEIYCTNSISDIPHLFVKQLNVF